MLVAGSGSVVVVVDVVVVVMVVVEFEVGGGMELNSSHRAGGSVPSAVQDG